MGGHSFFMTVLTKGGLRAQDYGKHADIIHERSFTPLPQGIRLMAAMILLQKRARATLKRRKKLKKFIKII